MDIILRWVKGYGWLPIIERDGNQIYRGEFQVSPQIALDKALYWLEESDG